jgi:hypothetical protein
MKTNDEKIWSEAPLSRPFFFASIKYFFIFCGARV